jgi:hypothetical protein
MAGRIETTFFHSQPLDRGETCFLLFLTRYPIPLLQVAKNKEVGKLQPWKDAYAYYLYLSQCTHVLHLDCFPNGYLTLAFSQALFRIGQYPRHVLQKTFIFLRSPIVRKLNSPYSNHPNHLSPFYQNETLSNHQYPRL